MWCSIAPGGGPRRCRIGLHGRLTADEARPGTMALLGGVAKGGDPAEDRATRRATITIRQLCERYIQATRKGLILGKKGGPKKASTLIRDQSRIDRHILPLLAKRRVTELTRADVIRFMRDVSTGKTACVEKTAKLRGKSIVEGGHGTAARTGWAPRRNVLLRCQRGDNRKKSRPRRGSGRRITRGRLGSRQRRIATLALHWRSRSLKAATRLR